MAKSKMKLGEQEIEWPYSYPVLLPDEWIALVRKLHPVTAIVVWEVLTNNLSPETIALAQKSPDWERFMAMRIVGGGGASFAPEVAELARAELDEIFEEVLPSYATRRAVH